MANDPYSMCPCGSGKKLKFCCGEILPDLQRAFRIRDNQPEAAAKIFSDLLKKNPDKDVVARELTSTLYEMGQTAEARKVAADFLKSHPDHPGILLSLAEISLKEDGFEASRRILHRTFQLCSKTQPLGIAYLAAMIASTLAGILANASRLTTGRTRPRESPKIEQGFYGLWHEGRWLIGVPAYNSFPSGHTATAFGFATVIVFAAPAWGLVAVALAAAVAWSSIGIGAHHPSDVTVSILLSMVVGWAVWRFFEMKRSPLRASDTLQA